MMLEITNASNEGDRSLILTKKHLRCLILDYLEDRKANVCWYRDLAGLGLGVTLWNILYHSVSDMRLQTATVIGITDNLVLLIEAKGNNEFVAATIKSLDKKGERMRKSRLFLAAQSTRLLFFKKGIRMGYIWNYENK